MIRVETVILAQAASVENGKLYLMGGAIDCFPTHDVPTIIPTLGVGIVVNVSWVDSNTPYEVGCDIVNEDGASVLDQAAGQIRVRCVTGRPPTAVPGQELRKALAFNFVGVQYQSFGTYALIVHLDGKECTRTAFHLIHGRAS